MDDVAEYYGLSEESLPQVDLVRSVSPDEQLDVLAKCLTQAGFPTERKGGALVDTTPDDQRQSLGLAEYVCTGQYPVDTRYTTPLTDEQWEAVYDYQVSTTLPCIRDLGYEVSDPPTLSTYLETNPQERWDPIAEVEAQVTEDGLASHRWSSFDDFLQTCPPAPPSGQLRGLEDR